MRGRSARGIVRPEGSLPYPASIVMLNFRYARRIDRLQQASKDAVDLDSRRHALPTDFKQCREPFVAISDKWHLKVFVDTDPNMPVWAAIEIIRVDGAFTRNPPPRAGRINGGARPIVRRYRLTGEVAVAKILQGDKTHDDQGKVQRGGQKQPPGKGSAPK